MSVQKGAGAGSLSLARGSWLVAPKEEMMT
jgi:hypothetical protein